MRVIKNHFRLIFCASWFFNCAGDNVVNEINQPPHILSTPITTVAQNQIYTYVVEATDPDGNHLTFSAVHPSWLNFDAATATLNGLATVQNLGDYQIQITVSDGIDSVRQEFTLTVETGPNSPPQFISTPVTNADHNRTYSYTADATDANGDTLTFSAVHPGWLSFDAASRTLSGLATRENLGIHAITINATDGMHQTPQRFTITVAVGEIICDSDFGNPDSSLYVLPYSVGKTFTVSQSYCHPFGGHKDTFAYDFNTAIGDTIVASRAGIVTFTNDQFADGDIMPGNENNVFIGHDDGTRVRYTHLMQNSVLVNVGEQVIQGQPIALSGNTGNTGNFPHLHFAAFRDNTDFGRKNTLPVNFSNAGGPLDQNRGLIESQRYLALPFE